MTIAHTRFYKSRVGDFFCFPIGAPEMGVVKHATLWGLPIPPLLQTNLSDPI